eukprot:4113486-Amphidinium_carterae.1
MGMNQTPRSLCMRVFLRRVLQTLLMALGNGSSTCGWEVTVLCLAVLWTAMANLESRSTFWGGTTSPWEEG